MSYGSTEAVEDAEDEYREVVAESANFVSQFALVALNPTPSNDDRKSINCSP